MFERIRRRLTLGYVGIFALILLLIGAVVVASFYERANAQQDELLTQKAQGAADYTKSLLHQYQEGEEPGNRGPGGPPDRPVGPLQASTQSDIGVIALIPPRATGGGSTILDSSASSSPLGLPFEDPAQRAVQEGRTLAETVDGPEGEEMRVVSTPVTNDGVVGVVQTAQSRQAVHQTLNDLLFVLVPVGLGGLLLAGIGGLFMSRRAMQPVRDSFERQRTFIADASHELKTPLALAKVNAEVMARNPTNPENKEIVEDQLSEINRMDALLSDLLTLARLDSGRLEVENKPFDLSTVATEAAGRFLTRAATEGVRLEVVVPDELPVRGDPEKTAQILAVLLDNAMRYTPKGGSVTVSGRVLDGRAEASVADTGPGIPPEHLSRIFDRFYRVEEARTRKGGGTGLGLAIARDFTRAQGGDLWAENAGKGGTEGSGAVFRLQLHRQ